MSLVRRLFGHNWVHVTDEPCDGRCLLHEGLRRVAAGRGLRPLLHLPATDPSGNRTAYLWKVVVIFRLWSMLFGSVVSVGSVYHPENRFRMLAESVIPDGKGGIAYVGVKLSEVFGCNLHLYVHYGSMYEPRPFCMAWGFIDFSPCSWSGDGPSWKIKGEYHTRLGAVISLARALRLLDEELGHPQARSDLDPIFRRLPSTH